jgi:MAP/microtubule affinity-regulating kinase
MVGEGSFGKVFLAVQRSTNRLVALKRLDKATFKNEATRRKIMTELEIQKALFGHCNIVKLLEVFETEDFAYFVMEYAANGDLRRWLERRKRFSEDDARYAFFQIASGVRYIHSHGFIHRDIKLDNVLIDEHMHYKICDFGVGRSINPNELVLEQCGTPAYLAPEIIREHGYRGFSADVWSLGVLLYFMLVGQMPFRAQTIDRLNEVVLLGKYTFPEGLEVSDDARQLISRMLCLDPAIRAQMEEVLNHPWVNSINLDRATILDIKGFEEKKRAAKNAPVFTINEQVMGSLAGLGFDASIVRSDLARNEMNYATASYFTLEKDYV